MTGTAKTEEKEFLKMFKTPVIEVPANLPNIRKDLPIQAFATERGKWVHACEEIEFMFRLGRPVLVGTTSMLLERLKLLPKQGESMLSLSLLIWQEGVLTLS
nr:protein translocase subunit SECA2, chloroplastic [Ipomoea batatas]GME04657.1 protein translocase subunit SECA2, chloroplastic [Ipomoea batatas]